MFEIIDTKREKLEYYFSYEEIAWRIPLNSGRMNRKYINDYLKYLVSVGTIHKYELNKPNPQCFTVFFVKNTQSRKKSLSKKR